METKRMAGPYEITHAIHIGDREIVLGENPADTEGVPYMCAYCEANDIIASYYDSVGGEDYAEIVGIFGERIKEQAEITQEKLRQECMDGEQSILVTEKDCALITSEDDLNHKVVVIRADVLRPEYRTASRQLRLCTGGFGASPHSRGSACYCRELRSGRQSRFERRDILGVMEVDRLPQWAKDGLAAIEQAEKKLTPKENDEPQYQSNDPRWSGCTAIPRAVRLNRSPAASAICALTWAATARAFSPRGRITGVILT